MTDANVVLGRLDPKVPIAGGLRLDARAAREALREVAGPFRSLRAAAEGVIAVANEEMVRAIRVVSVEQGHDPRGLELVAFGGAGPLHACDVADLLGMRAVVVPAAGGVLSALGIAVGDRRTDAVESVMRPLGRAGGPGRIRGEAECELRYRGQAHELSVPVAPRATLAERFHARHRERFGFDDPDGEIEVVSVRVSRVTAGPALELPRAPRTAPVTRPRVGGARRGDAVGRRRGGRRGGGRTARGGWRGDRPGRPPGARGGASRRRRGDGRGARPLRPLRQHQGAARLLDRGVRPRRADDRPGRAPARPSGSDARRGRGRAGAAAARRGEVWVINDPYTGGTHLPDITLVVGRGRPRHRLLARAPRRRRRDAARVRCRPGRRELLQEGVVIPPLRLTRRRARACSSPTCESRPSGWPTCARRRRAWRSAPSACANWRRGSGERRCCAGWTSCTPTASGGSGRGSSASRTVRTRPRTSSRATASTCATSRSGCAVTVGRRPGAGRLRGHGAAAAGQHQLPDRGHALGRLLLRPVGLRSRHPGVGRRVRAGRGGRARGVPRERAAAGGGRRREHRDVEPDRRRRHVGARARRPRAGARAGDDEQRHVRDARVHLLRDARRRPGRRAGGARAERRPRGDVEHAEHADRGARARVSAADRALRRAAADRRRRPTSRRRRRGARLPRAGRLPPGPHDRAPPPRPARRRRRRGRRAREPTA